MTRVVAVAVAIGAALLAAGCGGSGTSNSPKAGGNVPFFSGDDLYFADGLPKGTHIKLMITGPDGKTRYCIDKKAGGFFRTTDPDKLELQLAVRPERFAGECAP